METLQTAQIPFLTEQAIYYLVKIDSLQFLFVNTDAWNMSVEEAEFNSAFFQSNTATFRVQHALKHMSASDMHLVHTFRPELDVAENLQYVIEAYIDHIEDVNEEIRTENKLDKTNVPELEFWPVSIHQAFKR